MLSALLLPLNEPAWVLPSSQCMSLACHWVWGSITVVGTLLCPIADLEAAILAFQNSKNSGLMLSDSYFSSPSFTQRILPFPLNPFPETHVLT